MGTIQKVFWSKGGTPQRTKTLSTHIIPKGFIYGDIGVGYSVQPGTFKMVNEVGQMVLREDRYLPIILNWNGASSATIEMIQWGLLRFEKKIGMLGAVCLYHEGNFLVNS